jgi:predicted Zn-dependent protease
MPVIRVFRADFTVTIAVTCNTALPDAQMKAGTLEISAALILLLSSEDEVAAVLAHELAHFTLAHDHKGMENFSRLTPFALKRFKMQQEAEADAESLSLLANAGYDPYAAVQALSSVRNFLSANQIPASARHPHINVRIRMLDALCHEGTFSRVPHRNDDFAAITNELRVSLRERVETIQK